MLRKVVALAVALLAAALALPGAALAAKKPPRTVVWAVGDAADGSAEGRQLARYVRAQKPDRFIYLGDVYEDGAPHEFRAHYAPIYGRLARRTDPVLGNHEFRRRFEGYFPYWKRARGFNRESARHRAYLDDTGWQLIAYSSESDPAVESTWLRAQLALHAGTCRIAAGHRGRYVVADDEHGDGLDQQPIWDALAWRTAINLIGHNHLYGRLAPIDGVHVLVSGAGGQDLRAPGVQLHEVAALVPAVPTATRLVLRRGAADFTQVDARGRVYDFGTIPCTPAG